MRRKKKDEKDVGGRIGGEGRRTSIKGSWWRRKEDIDEKEGEGRGG